MHTEYHISLPDYVWAVAANHKLIPLVSSIFRRGLGNGRPSVTYIAIRSGKHALDYEKILALADFGAISKYAWY